MATRQREKAKKKIGFYWDADLVTDFHRFVAERYGSVEHSFIRSVTSIVCSVFFA